MKYLSSHIYPLGIRWQLMFWYSFVFGLLMVFAGLLVYNRLQSTLAGSLDTELQLQAQQIAGDITIDDGQGITVHDATADLPGFGHSGRGQHSPPPADVNLDILVRVLDKNGQPLRTTPAFYALIVPPQSVTQPLHGLPWQGTITTVDGQAVRLYSRALVSDNGIFGVVQVGNFGFDGCAYGDHRRVLCCRIFGELIEQWVVGEAGVRHVADIHRRFRGNQA